MTIRKNIYMQLAPICEVERKHDGFLLKFTDGTEARVSNSRQARTAALSWLNAALARFVTDTLDQEQTAQYRALVSELEQWLEEHEARASA